MNKPGALVCYALIAMWTVIFLVALVPLVGADDNIKATGIGPVGIIHLLMYTVLYSIPTLLLVLIASVLNRKP